MTPSPAGRPRREGAHRKSAAAASLAALVLVSVIALAVVVASLAWVASAAPETPKPVPATLAAAGRHATHARIARIARLRTAGGGVGARALLAAPSPASSLNWAGYAVTARRRFRRVIGSWVEPEVSCGGSTRGYSAFWVGLGGFAPGGVALEQVGTEADCAPDGQHAFYAWYELLPAPEMPLRMSVHPGDRMAASVTVTGHHVALHLRDLTSGAVSVVDRRMAHPDTTSAEWIAEAPSACTSTTRCRTLPLADFASVSFGNALAATRGGPLSPITAADFEATQLALRSSGLPLGVHPTHGAGGGEAAASPLGASGAEFTVTWAAG